MVSYPTTYFLNLITQSQRLHQPTLEDTQRTSTMPLNFDIKTTFLSELRFLRSAGYTGYATFLPSCSNFAWVVSNIESLRKELA